MQEIISEIEKEQIKAAIGRAEVACSAEIVTVMARSSDSYGYIALLWAAMGALVLPTFLLMLLPEWDAGRVYTAQLLLFLLLMLFLQVDTIRMALIPKKVKRRRAAEAARKHFILQQFHKTTNRASVMLFVSHAERYVEILTDIGVSQKIPDKAWQKVVDTFINHVRNNEVAQGYLEAIGMSGELLSTHFPPVDSDRDELPNRLIEV